MTSVIRVSVGLSLAAGLSFAGPAAAACHAFTISASPSSVNEGSATTVTVSRDADINPSSVRVRTVDGTAKAGSDYAAVAERTVTFASGTTQTFPVSTTDDGAAEGAETFRVELVEGSGGGCAANPDFGYGPPATVTIKASDQPAPTTPPTTAPPGTPQPTASRTTAAAATTAAAVRTSAPAGTQAPATSAPVVTTSPPALAVPTVATVSPSTDSPAPTALAEPVGGGDDGLPLAALGLVALVAAGALGFAAFRHLRA